MSKALKYTFLIHAIIAFLIGVPLLVGPGRVLPLLGWMTLDSFMDRILGAALIGLAWSSWRGWQATDKSSVMIVLEQEVIFTMLAVVGLLRELSSAAFPSIYWLTFVVLAIFAIVWIIFRFGRSKTTA